jgi:excisionase family DNA binding protein
MTRTPKADATPIPAWATAESGSSRAHPSSAPDLADQAFLTVAEAASWLRVSQKTIRRQIAGGGLPACRVGRSVRIPAKALETLT